jgi:uncharacterized protein (DUF885 family)
MNLHRPAARAVSRAIAAAAAALVAACASHAAAPLHDTAPPRDDTELIRLEDARRLDIVIDHVLDFREGLLRESLDRGRVDRADRASAAKRRLAELMLMLDATGDLDVEASVDRDLARMVLDGAVLDLAIAAERESVLRKLAGPATALAFLADPDPPSAATIALLAGGADDVYPVASTPDDEVAPRDLRSAAQRNRQVAGLLRTRGAQCQVLDAAHGAEAHVGANEAAGRAEDLAKRLDERAEKAEKDADRFTSPAGRATFVARLATHHGVDATPEELVAFGEAMLAETTRDLEALAAAEFPGRTWKQALEEVRADHAQPAQMPAEALAAAESARDFTIREGFVTIPNAARLAHIEMVDDNSAKSYPFAAYSFRRPTSDGESGRYVVSPGATWMDDAQRDERLRGNCRAWTRVVAAHETWPGHHLQFWVADHAVPRIRREVTTPVFVEGWGLYCEGLLQRHGWIATPAQRLVRLVMRAWRASRVILDVKLHCEAMPPKDAIDFLVEHVAMPRDGATAEVRRYCDQPTQPFAYAWGCREIERLYSDEQARLGAAFDERAFHDRLLRCGAIPFPLVRRLFGYADR